jgi:predicted AlkP superfamily pyrophosphatase or phosphodiesterase
MKRLIVALAVAASFVSVTPAQVRTGTIARSPQPKLIVFIAVDQMRDDYIDHFLPQWTAGLRRLVTQGARFRQADYPYFNTVTCAGHASLSTGTVPAVHGMILNTWWDRSLQKAVNCTDDDREQLIAYSGTPRGIGQSAHRLIAPTLSDELRLQARVPARVASVSLKARSAISLGGHRPDAATWMDDDGNWVTSTAFTKAPLPFIDSYVKAHPVSQELGRAWDRALPKERYVYEDTPAGRRKVAIGTTSFPHQIRTPDAPIDSAFVDAWEASPFSDAYVAALAKASIDGLKLGRNGGTDFLGISFSALDKVGHDFGPDSHEVQDVLIRLDREIGLLLDKLDREVGRGEYVVALSADHGVAPIPERAAAAGFDAGRIDLPGMLKAIDAALSGVLGPGKYSSAVFHTDVYLAPGVYEKLLENPAAMEAALKAMRDTAGVWRAYPRDVLRTAASDADPITRAASRSYYDGRSGDLTFLPRAYWITSSSTASHGTGHRYDTHVPVVMFGKGIKPGEYMQPASPIDIAPTLAFLGSVTLADPMGRVLVEALELPAAASLPPHKGPAYDRGVR